MNNTQTEADELNRPHPTAIAIASLKDGVAVLYPEYLLVWAYQNHKLGDCIANIRLNSILQTTDNQNDNALTINQATTLAVSSDGNWLCCR